jgi:predicted dehydrogenase
MKVGLVGAGFVASNYHIPSILRTRDVELVAVCEENPTTLRRVSERFGIKNRFENIETMLEKTDLDLVDIATPGFTHYKLCNIAMDFGVHVLVEKPVTLSSKDAAELRSKSRRENVSVCVMQNYRYRDATLRLLEHLRTGRIGKINSMITQHHGSSIFGQPKWMWNESLSGGVLYENAIHSVDLHTFLLGPHSRVLGVDSNFDQDLELTTAIRVLIKHESGAVSLLDLAWFASAIFFRSDIAASITDATLKLQPDALILRSGETGPWTEATGDIRRLLGFGRDIVTGRHRTRSILPHYAIFSLFVESIKKGLPPPIGIDDVMPTMKLLDEIKKQMQDNSPSAPSKEAQIETSLG